ncbi:hypothetical protein PWEIH_00415 [Listeria weihenstephanensis FSL R9-0317]|nr:hypothetical protein PWEIH_00415 [Listeria weihenstephanensis FSL R9-0317]
MYGLNGSGKTTILDIIHCLLSGDLESIFKYKFDKIEAEIQMYEKLKKFSIQSFELEYVVIYDDIQLTFIKDGKRMKSVEVIKDLTGNNNLEINYGRNSYIEKEKLSYRGSTYDNFLDILRKDLNSIYIPITRKILMRETLRRRPSRENSLRRNRSEISNSVILAEDYYDKFQRRNQMVIMRNQRKIEDKMFASLVEPLTSVKLSSIPVIDNIDDLKESILELSPSENLRHSIDKLFETYNRTGEYFRRFARDKTMASGYVEEYLLHYVAFTQIERLKSVAESVKGMKIAIENMKAMERTTLEVINQFFKQTNKRIFFDGEHLMFRNESGEKLELEHLSSGEKQLVIFFIFALIVIQQKNESNILLVDEPEISMHISWQEDLLPSLMKYNSDTQIIVATHSPDIIGNFTDRCSNMEVSQHG